MTNSNTNIQNNNTKLKYHTKINKFKETNIKTSGMEVLHQNGKKLLK